MNDSEKKAVLVLQIAKDLKVSEATIGAETVETLYSLIVRQQAEIDRLNIEINIETVKSESVRKFAEKLKEHSCNLTEYDEGGWSDTVSAIKVKDIDRLLEETGCNDG